MKRTYQKQHKQYIIKGFSKNKNSKDKYLSYISDNFIDFSENINDAFKFDNDLETGFFRCKNNHNNYISSWLGKDLLTILSCNKKSDFIKKFSKIYNYKYKYFYCLGNHILLCNFNESSAQYANKLIWLQLLDYCKMLNKKMSEYTWKPLRWNSKYINS